MYRFFYYPIEFIIKIICCIVWGTAAVNFPVAAFSLTIASLPILLKVIISSVATL